MLFFFLIFLLSPQLVSSNKRKRTTQRHAISMRRAINNFDRSLRDFDLNSYSPYNPQGGQFSGGGMDIFSSRSSRNKRRKITYPLDDKKRIKIKQEIAKRIRMKKSQPRRRKYAPAMIPAIAIPADQLIIDGLPQNINHVILPYEYRTSGMTPTPTPEPERTPPPYFSEIFGSNYPFNPPLIYTPTPTPFPVAMVFGMIPVSKKKKRRLH